MNNTEKFQLVPVASLIEAEWNYKEDNVELQIRLENNIARNGIVQNLIIRELGDCFFEVVNGNHRLRAIKSAGITEVMCYNCGEISDVAAKRIAIETNEIRFKSDIEKLASVVESILGEFDKDDFDLTSPITSDMLDGFKKQSEWEKPKPIEDTPFMSFGAEQDPSVSFVCPSCKAESKVFKKSVCREKMYAGK